MVISSENLSTTPANDYDLEDALSIVSDERCKRLALHMQDYPTGASAARKVNGPCDFGILVYGASRDSASTAQGALGLKFAVTSSLLVVARPIGTEPYTTDEQLQRAATIASGPAGFKALWRDLVYSATVPADPPAANEDNGDGDGAEPPPGASNIEALARRSQYYNNRAEFKKAYAALSPPVHADANDPKVRDGYIKLTPQAKPPRPEVTADEPGCEPQELDMDVFNKVHKALPRARKGGPVPLAYETVGMVAKGPARRAWYNACNSFVRGAIHDDVLALCGDLDGCLFWKDAECTKLRPLGMCDIFMRVGEKCAVAQINPVLDKFCTSRLPEDEAARSDQPPHVDSKCAQ